MGTTVLKGYGTGFEKISGSVFYAVLNRCFSVSAALKLKVIGCVICGSWRFYHNFRGNDFVAFNTVDWHSRDYCDKLAGLKNGLDRESLQHLDLILFRWQSLPSEQYADWFIVNMKKALTAEEWAAATACRKQAAQWKKQYPVACSEPYLPEVFLYHHGLTLVPDAVKMYMQGGDFIDAGAYCGDSALVLRNYAPRKIFSFEASRKNAERYRRTMLMNHVPETEYELVEAAVGQHSGTLNFADTADGCARGTVNAGEEVALVALDEFFAARPDSKVRFIKADIEGMGLEMVYGMTATLKKFRPVLSLAVYHNPDEFFLIKPALERLDLKYKFMLRKLNPAIMLVDTVLLAYPEELERKSLDGSF